MTVASLNGAPVPARRIADIPRLWAERAPAATALIEQGSHVSYGEFWQRIVAAAHHLSERGVVQGDRVMIVAENCIAELVCFFAACELGAWPLIVNARMSERELEVIRAHSQPRVQLYASAASDAAAAHARRVGAAGFTVGDLAGIEVAATDTSVHAESADLAVNVAMLLYTSGTTGAPKGVMLTHRGLLHFCQVSSASRALGPADVVYAVLPFSHIFGIATIVLSTLYAGACLCIESRFDPAKAVAALHEHRITTLQGVPMLWRRLLTHMRSLAAMPRFPHLRYLYVGGGGLESELKREIEQAFALPVHHGYGMTEYAGSMFITRMDEPRQDCSSGVLNPGCEARIVDEAEREVVAGKIGEIWVRGPGTMLGYYRAPALTREVLRPDGWLKTGDLGRLEPDGALFVVGRRKEMIKRSGFNVFPIEVESVLNSHPAVRLSAVVGRALRDGDEEVIAFLELHPDVPWQEAELRDFLAARLAPYKRPARIVCVESLPVNANGKIRKHELPMSLLDVERSAEPA